MNWKPIPGFDRYEVSEDGSVRKSINAKHPERPQFHLMAQEQDKDGYLRVCLQRKHMHVHRVVYLAFHGDFVDGLVVCHLDGDRKNNAPANLSQVTQKENIGHKRMHGTWQSGEKHPKAKLTNIQAKKIADALAVAERGKRGLQKGEAIRISKEVDVSVGMVHAISRTRRSYDNELRTGL